MKESGPRGFVDIPGKYAMELTITVLLLPARLAFTCCPLPRAGMCTAPHTAQPTPASCIPLQSESQTPQHSEGTAGRGEFAGAPLCLAGALLGEESMSPVRAMPKSSLAPGAICRQVLALLPGAAAISKGRYASKQAWYWQEPVSLAQPALLLHLAHEQAPALGL